MEHQLERAGPLDAVAAAPAYLARRLSSSVSSKLGSAEPYEVLWWIFAASVTISTMSSLVGEVPMPLAVIMAIGGAAGCGWLWLMARALFRPSPSIAPWNLMAVGAIVVVEASWHLVGLSVRELGEVERIVTNAASLICVSATVMVFVEILTGYNAQLPKPEKQFRQIFTIVLGAMIAFAFLWTLNAEEGSVAAQLAERTSVACALTAIIATRLAVSFRKRHPLPESARKNSRAMASAPPNAEDRRLGDRILHALEADHQFATPELKVADLAARLGEHDYKISQCITGVLGYRNFNHLINARRVDYAKQLLTSRDHEGRPILSIAFDCGFNSIGPFNRAFKEQVGMTPREYRIAAG